jgi:ribose transport system substrate-binding protein
MKKNYKIGLVMKSLQADFFKVMKEGAVRYAASLPFLDLVCVGTATQTEITEQINLVNSLINQQVDAIVLVPIDSKALVPPVVEAVRKGIPVINIDIRLDSDLLKQAGVEVAFVGPDNFAAAYEVGKLLSARLQPEDEVAIIEGLAVADNAQQRKSGFIKSIEEKRLRLIASEPADWETAKAIKVFQNLWVQHSDLKAVYCSNDAMALGVLRLMQEKDQYLPVVGFDNDAVMKDFLSTGRLVATADIFSSQMAVRGIEFALNVLEGKMENRGIHTTPYAIVEK